MEFRERVLVKMQEENMRAADLATKSGLDKSHIHYILTGKTKNPRVDVAIQIADALGVDYNYIFGYEESGEKCGENSGA